MRRRKSNTSITSSSNNSKLLFMRHILLFIILILSTTCCKAGNIHNNNNNIHNTRKDPYKILGISKNANQEEIRKKYKQLCLKYHPDKNVHITNENDRIKCENAFKDVQEANSLIGSSEARRQYDYETKYHHHYHQNHNLNNVFQQYYSSYKDSSANNRYYNHDPYFKNRENNNRYQFTPRRRFYVNGIDISHLFQNDNYNNGGGTGLFPNNPFFDISNLSRRGGNDVDVDSNENYTNGPKSIYVQKVFVPLEDLYSGVHQKEFQFRDGFFQAYRAAFRGGIAAQICLQGIMTSAPLLLRTSWPITLLAFLLTCHVSLPRPTKLFYVSSIKRGWKSGTKLTFQQPGGIDISFIIEEKKHDRFVRIGNNLQTTVTIGRSKAKKGCTFMIEPLSSNELPIMVTLKRGEVVGDRHVVEVKGKGWPKSDGSRGDLVVTIKVVSDSSKKRKKNSSRQT